MKNILKIASLNFIILIDLIIFLETIFFSARFVLKKQNLGWVLPHEAVKDIHAPCLRMMTHPILGLSNFHNNECNIKNGQAVGEFVYYNHDDSIKKETILVLGGSTSSGFNMHYANGTTWPELLSLKCKKEKNCNTINGAVSSYNSSHEMLKLITNISKFTKPIDLVISLNGINETNFIKDFPFFSSDQIYMIEEQKWLVRSVREDYLLLFPNIQSAFRLLMKTRQKDIISYETNYDLNGDLKNLHFPNSNIKNAVDRWENNIKAMNATSSSFNAKYYVFLQPTLGIDHLTNKNIEDSYHITNYSKKYLKNISLFYLEASKRCKKLDFCYDFSEILFYMESDETYDGRNYYHDGRHYNENGNLILSDKIYSVLY